MIRRNLSYANVMATIAVFVALGGGAIAASAKKNSVTTRSIKPGNVTATDLAGIQVVVGPPQGGKTTATCPVGTRLISGGGRGDNLQMVGPPIALQSSHPDGNGWTVQPSAGGSGNVAPYALCLKAKPGT